MKHSKTRELIELLIADNDPFGYVVKSYACAIPVKLVTEAWSPEKKAEIMADTGNRGYRMIDHLVMDDYDLVLWFLTKVDSAVNEPYVVSINNAQHDPTQPDEQAAHFSADSGNLPIKAIKEKLMEWIAKYGSLAVCSYVPERNVLYYRMAKRQLPNYQFSPFYGNTYNYGFRLSAPKVEEA